MGRGGGGEYSHLAEMKYGRGKVKDTFVVFALADTRNSRAGNCQNRTSRLLRC